MKVRRRLAAALKQYKIGFEIWGFGLFFLIMLPNFIWFSVPAPQDILRQPSVTPTADGIASACQVLMVAALCLLKNHENPKPTLFLVLSLLCCLLYYLCWGVYYAGIVHKTILLGLAIFPCLAFAFFAADRKNAVAMIPIFGFTICHLLYAVVNFMG